MSIIFNLLLAEEYLTISTEKFSQTSKMNCSTSIYTDEEIKRYANLEWWLDGVANIVVCSLGIISNLLAVPVLLSRRLTNVFYRTLAILALFDIIFLACDLLESVRRNHYHTTSICVEAPFYQKLHMYLFPKFLRPLQNIAMVASIYTTIVVALGRYLAVAKPISTMVQSGKGNWKTVLIYVLPVVAFSIVFKLPIFWEFYNEWCDVDCLNRKKVGGPYCINSYNKTPNSEFVAGLNATEGTYTTQCLPSKTCFFFANKTRIKSIFGNI